MRKAVTYFDKPGPANTEETIKVAKQRAAELGVKHVVVATNSGETAEKVAKEFEGLKVKVVAVVPTHVWSGRELMNIAKRVGLTREEYQCLEEWKPERERLKRLEDKGVEVVPGIWDEHGVSRGVSRRFGGITPVELIAETLRLFGQGVKVCVEVAVEAADAGAVPEDVGVVAIAGTVRGADTAILLKPARMDNFFDLEVMEVIAKPRRIKV